MIKTLALIHTSPVLVPTFTQLAAEVLPGVNIFHMVDESLIKNTMAAGRLTKLTARRVLSLIESAQQAGAEAAMVTCSSIGHAVSLSRPFIGQEYTWQITLYNEVMETPQTLNDLFGLRLSHKPTCRLSQLSRHEQPEGSVITDYYGEDGRYYFTRALPSGQVVWYGHRRGVAPL